MTTFTDIGAIAAATAAKTRKRTMVVFLAAIAASIGMTCGFVYSQHVAAASVSKETAGVRNDNQLWSVPASRKVRCIMPPAWRRDCPDGADKSG